KQIKETLTDFRAKINIENNTYFFIILVCRRPYPSEIKSLLEKIRKEKGNFLLLGTYFPQGTQNFLEKERVDFLDLSGNCSVNVSQQRGNQKCNVNIKISGKQNRYPSTEVLKNVFSGKSSRIVRALLEEYPQKFKPLQLSKKCRVSPALVTRVIEALEQESFVSREGEITLVDPGLLLDQWADNYQFKRNSVEAQLFINKPTNEVLRFFAQEKGLVLTRTAAASLIAPFADYQIIEVYKQADLDINKLLEQGNVLLLQGAKGANVIIIIPYDEGVFDYAQKVDDYNTVGLIQLYLDLYSDPKRGKEQAAFLRERKLKF
ncbi:hypothetical protein KKA47_02050, partial [bacterium]|nr:hypothetical protein [bacterium]